MSLHKIIDTTINPLILYVLSDLNIYNQLYENESYLYKITDPK